MCHIEHPGDTSHGTGTVGFYPRAGRGYQETVGIALWGGCTSKHTAPLPPSEWHKRMGGQTPLPESMAFGPGGGGTPPPLSGICDWGVRVSGLGLVGLRSRGEAEGEGLGSTSGE